MNFIKFVFQDKNKEFYIFNLIIPLFFIIFALILMPIDKVFYFDPDEGIELAKATLASQNLIFDHEFWDPQPLLFNIILGKYLNLVGFSIIKARIFTLFFATICIWCFAHILRLSVGNISALISIFLLIISINFLRLSVSVMQGLPCLTLAVLAIYWFMLYSNNGKLFFLILSGISLATSLQTKMITVFLIPVIIIFIFLNFPEFKRKVISIFYFLIAITLGFIIIGILTHSLDLQKIFLFHISDSLQQEYAHHNSLKYVILVYLQNFDFFLLTIVGINLKIIKNNENKFYLIPLLWLVTITLLFINYKPLWYHYIILINIPLIWLGSYGIKTILLDHNYQKLMNFDLWQSRKKRFSKFTIFTLFFTLFVIPIKIGVITLENHDFIKNSQKEFTNLQRILTYKNQTNWLFTDIAMYNFYSHINIPSEIAVLPQKRLISHNLNQQLLLDILQKYQPEQILIERFPIIIDEIKPYLDTNYHQIYADQKTKHYILNSLNQTD